MFANRTLARWHQAGLLDDATRDRISAWEAAHARPVWLWALAGIGVFAFGLGVLALVAANWERIPGAIKIGLHLLLDGATAGALFAAWRAGRPRRRELLALLLFGLTLSGVGLVGQVYQLGGTAWQALLVWMLACTPFMLLTTRSGPVGIAWQCGALATYAWAAPELLGGFDSVMAPCWAAAIGLLACGLLRGALPGGLVQGAWMEQAAGLALLSAGSLPQILLLLDGSARSVAPGLAWGLAGTLALLPLAALRHRRAQGGLGVPVILALAGWAVWAASVGAWASLGHGDAGQLAEALIFIAFWSLASWLALRSGRRGLFGLALLVVGLRIFVFYWEALGSLLSTGLGLLLGGLVCVALAAAGWRVMRHTLPSGPAP